MTRERFPSIPGEASEPPLRFGRDAMSVAEKALLEAGRTVLGKGAESLVEVHPTDPEKVVAHSFRKELRAKETLHAHHVLKTLFPKHFPAIYEAFENSEGSRGGTIRERVYDSGQTIKKPARKWFGKQKTDERTFEYVNKELEAIGIRGLHFDGESERNFAVSAEGYQQYLDTSPFIARELVLAKDDVLAYMDKKGSFSSTERSSVEAAIDALAELIKSRTY